jgi:hypothetical protein
MPKELDPMWVYGEPVQLPNRQVLTCNLCGKKIFAGISLLKYHLAKIPGFDVDACPKSTPEIMHIANQSLIDMANKMDVGEAHKKELELANRNTGTSAFEGGTGTTIPLLSHRVLNFYSPLINLTFLCAEVNTWGATFYSVID